MRKNRPSRKARKRRRVIARYCAAIVGMYRKRQAMAPGAARQAKRAARAHRANMIAWRRARKAASKGATA